VYDSLERTSFSSASSSFVEEGVGIHAASQEAATWSARNFSFSSIKRAYHAKRRNQNKLKPSYITFLTDVEGDGDYFDRFVRHSKILGFRSREPSYGNYGPVSKNDVNVKWNLGEVDDDYFPYDKEVIFLEDEEFTSNSKGGEEKTRTMLVYGGDVWDKGGADLYVIRQLLSLHRRYPHRVHFLMGNRDINKMRIVDELGVPSHNLPGEKAPLPYHGGVYWLRGTGFVGDPLVQRQIMDITPHFKERSTQSKFRLVVPSESATERLKWMLGKTMGSVDAFEFRRSELKKERLTILNSTSSSNKLRGSKNYHYSHHSYEVMEGIDLQITDEEVFQSYIRSCDPSTGLMGEYLSHAKLIIRFGPALFLHGALPFSIAVEDGSIVLTSTDFEFPTPWKENCGTSNHSTLLEWMNDLNQFASSQVKSWKEYGVELSKSHQPSRDGVWATDGGYFNDTPGGKRFGALLQYGMGTLPHHVKNTSVVYNSWMSDGMPRSELFCDKQPDGKNPVGRFMKNEKLQIILSGHQPIGDMPWPILVSSRDETNGSARWVIPCDTSFSGDTGWTTTDGCESTMRKNVGRGSVKSGRGEVSICETLVKFCHSKNEVSAIDMHGCLSDGSNYVMKNITSNDYENFRIGRALATKQKRFYDTSSGISREGIFWIKAKFGHQRLVSHGKGYNVWNALIR